MAEGLLRHRLAERSIGDVVVSSAGFLSDGEKATPDAVRVMAKREIDIHLHTSRVATAELLDGSDLIVAMARQHVRQGAVLAPDSFERTFTLKELVRRGSATGARGDDESIAAWLARVAEGRSRVDHLGDASTDDIADPVGRPLRVYKRTAVELDELLAAAVELLWPAAG